MTTRSVKHAAYLMTPTRNDAPLTKKSTGNVSTHNASPAAMTLSAIDRKNAGAFPSLPSISRAAKGTIETSTPCAKVPPISNTAPYAMKYASVWLPAPNTAATSTGIRKPGARPMTLMTASNDVLRALSRIMAAASDPGLRYRCIHKAHLFHSNPPPRTTVAQYPITADGRTQARSYRTCLESPIHADEYHS